VPRVMQCRQLRAILVVPGKQLQLLLAIYAARDKGIVGGVMVNGGLSD
jgi:hypothetical protein